VFVYGIGCQKECVLIWKCSLYGKSWIRRETSEFQIKDKLEVDFTLAPGNV
jgi:hypothetical protein